jgi:DHA1 family tetracycline resistance protein-like MFS transporter
MTSASARGVPRTLLWFLVCTTFLGAMGIGLVNPIVPYLAERFAAQNQLALVLSALAISYSGAAFLAAPALGALSDRFGRRPVLLLSVLGSAVGYALFGAAHATWVLVVGRLIDGFTAGNFSAAFAAMADSTRAEERGRNFGYLGASAGAGLIAGPAIGGLLAHFGPAVPLYFAAALCLANAIFGFLCMPETRKKGTKTQPFTLVHLNPFTQLYSLLELSALRSLLVASVLFTVPFAMMTTLLALLSKDRLSWTATQASTVFIAVGLCDVAVQGALLGRLLKRLGERRAALFGLTLAAVGLAGMALISALPSAWLMFTAVVAFAVGEGIFTACLSALLSLAAGPEAQGRVQGGSQSLQSLAQIPGPLVGGFLYARVHPAMPFAVGALLLIGCAALFPRRELQCST